MGTGTRRGLLNKNILVERLEAWEKKNPCKDEAIDYLRSNYSDYSRLKRQPFSRFVHELLQQTPKSDKNNCTIRSPCHKKLKTSNSSEFVEADDEGTVATSKSESVDPGFDLLKSNLRANYSFNKYTNLEEEIEDENKSSNNKIGEKRKASSLCSLGDNGEEDDGPRFRDFGGMEEILESLEMDVMAPLDSPDVTRRLGVVPISALLLHGPPGCGKSMLAHAIANEMGLPFHKISATEVVSGVSGTSEQNIRDLFSKAYKTAPSVVFIDEIDTIASKRDSLDKGMERRIVTQLMTCMDDAKSLLLQSERSDSRGHYVLVIGATNRPDAIEPALRRAGRFDLEIVLGVPDEKARFKILSVLTRKLRLEGSIDLEKLSRSTPGFVGADLAGLVTRAGTLSMRRILYRRKSQLIRESLINEQTVRWWVGHPMSPEEKENASISMKDFEEALKLVQPSLTREGFSTLPSLQWEDIGVMGCVRKAFDFYIIGRIKFPKDYEEFGLDCLGKGFLLYGPPGCGKTIMAKAIANEAGANFIHIKGPEILNKYVGQSELAVRELFRRARTCSPCIIFFDEVDALTTQRGREGGWVVERLVNQLLVELQETADCPGVYVIGATNRPDVVDPAFLRPGRLGNFLYVPLPNAEERELILKVHTRKKPIHDDVDLSVIARMKACENLSGADLAALVNDASVFALLQKRELTSRPNSSSTYTPTIKLEHFQRALLEISPSVSNTQKKYYRKMSAKFKSTFMEKFS